jgi:signal transduction histidine kinase
MTAARKLYPMSKVDPADTRMDLICVSVRLVLVYLHERYTPAVVDEFIFQTNMNRDYLEDNSNWISLPYYYKLLDKLVEFTGNPNAPFEAGLYASERNCLGALNLLVAQLGTTASMYRISAQMHPRWSKVNEWKLLKMDRNTARISVRNFSLPQNKNNCLCIKGVLASMPKTFGLPPAQVIETECACDGANACIYEIAWITPPKRSMALVGLLAGLVVGCVTYAFNLSLLISALLGAIGYLMGRFFDINAELHRVYRHDAEKADSLQTAMQDMESLNQKLQQKVETRTEELQNANTELARTLSELKNSEEKKIVAEKQAVVGVLAAGMAHELNTPINAIRLTTQSLREDLAHESKFISQLDMVLRVTDRCKRIIDDVLSLSREPRQERNVRIEEIVETSVRLYETEHPDSIRIAQHIEPNLPNLFLDKLQMRQVMLTLLKNAADAMNDRGNVEVSLARDGDRIVLNVKDSGSGIKESDRLRIFDPFFTTKPVGKGMGLGLSIAYQLVQKNGGTIDVMSEEGKGTVFTVRFPIP